MIGLLIVLHFLGFIGVSLRALKGIGLYEGGGIGSWAFVGSSGLSQLMGCGCGARATI